MAIAAKTAQIVIEDGHIDDSSTHATRLEADTDGRFSIPARDESFYLVIVHGRGHALVSSGLLATEETIELKTWASIQGVFRIGSKPGANLRLEMDGDLFETLGEN